MRNFLRALKGLLPCRAKSPWNTRCTLAKGHNYSLKGIYHGDIAGRLWS